MRIMTRKGRLDEVIKYIDKKYVTDEGLIDRQIPEQDAVDCLKKLYEALYKKVDDKNRNPNMRRGELTICPAIKGAEYANGPMFIGRAINSWCPLKGSIDEKETFFNRLKRCEQCTLDWVNGENVWDHCINHGCIFANNKRTDGRDKLSPFWQMVKYIYKEQYNNHIEDKKWYKKILWSNLYKASYVSGGNPDGFYKNQVLICNAILILEIILYKPSDIYFITEKNGKAPGKDSRTWFCSQEYGTAVNFQEVYDFLINSEWRDKVFVLNRPEFQEKQNVWDAKEDLNGNGKVF